MEDVRSETALKVFKHCHEKLQKSEDDTKWKEYENTKDHRLKNKGVWGMDSRCVYYVTESEQELQELSTSYPGRIILCDRTKIKDTQDMKSLEDTHNCHEVRSVAYTVPQMIPREWPAHQEDLPCALCPQCRDNPFNVVCPFATWRNSRRVSMIEQGEDEELTDYSLEALMKLRVPELKHRCRAAGVATDGKKEELALRLRKAKGEANQEEQTTDPPPLEGANQEVQQ